MSKTITQLKTDVSAMTGISEQDINNIETLAPYFVQTINANINAKQFKYENAEFDLPDDLYYCALVPIASDFYSGQKAANSSIVSEITEGDSKIVYDVEAMTNQAARDYSSIFSKYRKLVSI